MSDKDLNEPVDLSDPKAREYANRIAAAKQGKIPVGGAPMPDIPRLDQPPPGAPRDRALGVQQSKDQQARMQAMTPDEYQQAIQSGQAIPGVGAAYVANQPKGFQPPSSKTDSPPMKVSSPQEDGHVNPPRPEGGLRQETLDQLQDVAKANAKKEEEDPLSLKEANETLDGITAGDYEDDIGFPAISREAKNLLANKERRKAIEARCEDMDFEELIFNQELRQSVPIRKGFSVVFRTPRGDEDLFVKRKISGEEGSDRYIMDKYAILGLCCGLYSINDKPLPEHRDKEGDINDKLFAQKFKLILKYPIVVVADMSVNFVWFTERVQQLLALDKVQDF